MRRFLRHAPLFAGLAALALAACASGQKWVAEVPETRAGNSVEDAWRGPDPSTPAPVASGPMVAEIAGTPRAIAAAPEGELFRNTYYDFPREGAGDKSATIFDASCAPIAKVTQEFHDRVCVQGSGRLSTGQTVSFAKRDCACAAVCPRTSQKICFERLDPARFPHGRGATGGPITPMRTVAVDTTVIPLGTPIYIPEMRGVPRPDGTEHDGCFVAEDRGLKVVGRHLDIFTGDPALTAQWNRIVPSNQGVHARIGDSRCASR
jgi:3D (Asp-Asp-Asp) domain-containing protein